jgi:hypothetical protein
LQRGFYADFQGPHGLGEYVFILNELLSECVICIEWVKKGGGQRAMEPSIGRLLITGFITESKLNN